MQHLDEGTIHAWLDGQLPLAEAQAVEAHVAECRQCADAVAEARGLIAASSRILTALDGVPRDVMPKIPAPVAAAAARSGATPATELPVASRAEARARRRWLRGPSLAAAATIIVAVGTFTLMRVGADDGRGVTTDLEHASAPTAASARAPDSVGPSSAAPSGSARRESALRESASSASAAVASAPAETQTHPPAAPTPSSAVAGATARKAAADAPAAQQRAFADAAGAASIATGTVRGRVADANNTGLTDAMVAIAGTSIGVATDSAGNFVLSGVPSGAQRVTARRIGYAGTQRSVSVAGGQTLMLDLVLVPSTLSLESVVVTGTQTAQRLGMAERGRVAASTSPSAPASPAADAQRPAPAYGCYVLGITPGSAQTRTGFREIPRRIALDSAIASGRADGVWYQVRDLDARPGTAPNGAWRPTGPNAVEVEWSYGSRTAQVHLTGSGSAMMRGMVQEIDRATATGEGGSVVAVRRACGG